MAPGGSVRPSQPQPIVACTFDCYGTLIDWRKGIEENLTQVLREHGYSGPASVYELYVRSERGVERRYRPYREVLAVAATEVARALGITLPDSSAAKFAETLPGWPPFGDTVEVLKELGRRGVQRFILSNVDRDLLRGTIHRGGLEVDGSVTAEDVRSYKPALAHWGRFFQEHPFPKDRVLHVAHSLFHDIEPARQLGLRSAWVRRYEEPGLAESPATYVLNDLRGLLSLPGVPSPSGPG